MSAKIFIKGDFRDFFVSEKDSRYKVFYNGKWNNVQSRESVISDLTNTEHYINNYVVKIYDNGLWVDLALLENYYSDFELQKSVFYQLLTKDNFIYNLKEVDETNIDFRIGLNNLRCVLKFNENFEFINSDLIIYDSLYSFLNKEGFYDKELIYNVNTENIYENIDCEFESFLENRFFISENIIKNIDCRIDSFDIETGTYLVDSDNGITKTMNGELIQVDDV